MQWSNRLQRTFSKKLQVISLPYLDTKSLDQPSSDQQIFDSSSPDSDVFLDHNTGLDGPQQDYIIPVTKSIQKLKLNKRKYNNTSNELRLELIDAVENQGEKIKSV